MVAGVTARLEAIRDEAGKVAEALRVLQRQDVMVGIPEEKSSREEDGDINSAELLYIHTHGIRRRSMRREMKRNMDAGMTYSAAYELYIRTHGSPLWHAPPRPVLEPAIDAHRDEIAEQLQKAALLALDGSSRGTLAALKRAGMTGQNVARAWFVDEQNNWPENADATIAAKGSSRPLIDTGTMRKSIVYVLRERGRG
jgi:hypothetical protein